MCKPVLGFFTNWWNGSWLQVFLSVLIFCFPGEFISFFFPGGSNNIVETIVGDVKLAIINLGLVVVKDINYLLYFKL